MPVPIDGPAGRQEVTDEYRENYDRTFNGTSVCNCPDFDNCTRCIHGKVPPKVSPCRECLIATGKGIDGLHWTPKKSKKDGGKNDA